MSKTNSLSKVGVTEVVTGINFVGLCYLYYEIQKIGERMTKHIKDVSLVVKTVNSNVNVVYQHFTAHLIHHKNVLDVDNQDDLNYTSQDTDNLISKGDLLSRIEKLEKRLEFLESVNNPLHYNVK